MSEQTTTTPSEEQPEQMKPEEVERLHSAVVALEMQLQDIGDHWPRILGPALLSMSTFLVEKVYHCSKDVESANLLLAAAQEAGLQNWIDLFERSEPESQIVTLDS